MNNDSSYRADPRFALGAVTWTPGAREAFRVAGQTPAAFLARHQSGDWGEVGDEDRAENEFSVACDFRIMSVYRLNTHEKIWIITEADRSSTTILLPAEY